MARNLHSKKVNKDFKQIYKLPLILDEYSGDSIVWADDYEMRAFDFIAPIDKEVKQKIVDILNDKTDSKMNHDIAYAAATVFIDGNDLLMLRGWGYLTGIGGLRLSVDDASKVQDDFGQWIVEQLSKKQ